MTVRTFLAAVLLLATVGAAPAHAFEPGLRHAARVRHAARAVLKLDDKPFRFAGSNNYYLMYKSRTMVDDVFADAAAAKFTVLRTGKP